ncbi:dirigent protein 22 [Nicotiana tabacum]|uniref:Dirigent protein n=1 Tax=Nicotiana tabacum TaxID=4097 RepID=A0A1S3ZYN4_TOBAC|nr:dirigent protein 22-like [Nicotiana tomentosiformis]XP_016469401.1 PREDICTED: dirigent protein 22-like [Nicotiana tabacum]
MASNSIKISLILLLTTFICTEAELGQLKETRMTVYFQDWSGGPNATVLQITGHQNGPLSFAKFGSVFVTDDPITEAFDKNSAEIARAQGIYVTSALDGTISHVLISIIFTIEEYKGSTLEIQGASPQFERVREVAVVGGTGKFRLARGYATFETIHFDLAVHYVVIQCNVTVLHY